MSFWNGNGKEKPATGGVRPPAVVSMVETDGVVAGTAKLPARDNGTAAIARLVPNIEHALAVRDVLVQALKRLMVRDTDYGTIKGTQRDTLLQPGADKLCNLFQLVIRYEFVEKVEDWTGDDHGGETFFYYVVAGRAYLGETLMGEGMGSCNNWETKYRWRNVDRTCPNCGKANIRKSRDGGWYCWNKTGGCGTVYNDGDPAIEGQATGRRPNPDSADLPNTILKMALKRAKIATTINATSASEFFTQDVEDFSVSGDDGIDTGGHARGTQAAANHVAAEKIASNNPHSRSRAPWSTMGEMAVAFKEVRAKVGDAAFSAALERWGWHEFQDLRRAIDSRQPQAREKATECYWHLDSIARREVA